jgi:hypothetical protein
MSLPGLAFAKPIVATHIKVFVVVALLTAVNISMVRERKGPLFSAGRNAVLPDPLKHPNEKHRQRCRCCPPTT